MKLDRNDSAAGWGKYALVNMRKIVPLIESSIMDEKETLILDSFDILKSEGIITLGNESPGDQFFVMKYKDKFTHEALLRYAAVVEREAIHLSMMNPEKGLHDSLFEYADQIRADARIAARVGNRIPD